MMRYECYPIDGFSCQSSLRLKDKLTILINYLNNFYAREILSSFGADIASLRRAMRQSSMRPSAIYRREVETVFESRVWSMAQIQRRKGGDR